MAKEHRGVYVPLITPMTTDYKIDRPSLKALVEHLVESGVHGVVPNGSTGEFARLSPDERREVAQITVDAANGRVPVIVGAASPSTELSLSLSRHAQDIGADGLQIAPPFYGKPTEDEIYEHYRLISRAVDIPIFAYNNPWTTGTDMSPRFLQRLSEIENVLYVKEASGDSRRVSQIIRLGNGRLKVFAGSDDTMFESFLLGAVGWICGIANFAPRCSVELYDLCVERGDFKAGRELYYRLIPIGETLESGGKFVQLIKAGVELTGLKAGPPRRPQLPATDEERAQLAKMLANLDEHSLTSTSSMGSVQAQQAFPL
jgi:4-hydroxy-tetrahydrodipicolinate synthase